MTTNPSVSVIMPAYNTERFIASAVRSVLAQTHGALELIVVDDASTDDTVERVRAVADERVRLVSLAANVGVSAARNLALREARAPIVAFLDADDECVPERLAIQLEFLEMHPEVDVVGSAILAVDVAGRPLGYRTYPCGHEGIVRRLPLASPLAMPTVVARREALMDAGRFDSRLEVAEDYDLWNRLALRGRRFANCPQALVRYRLHAGAAKSRALRRQLRLTRAVRARYWAGRMGVRGRVRHATEGLLLLAPASLVWRTFVVTAYRRSGRRPL